MLSLEVMKQMPGCPHTARRCCCLQIAFGEVHTSKKSPAAKKLLGSSAPKLPALYLICNGDLDTKLQYQVGGIYGGGVGL